MSQLTSIIPVASSAAGIAGQVAQGRNLDAANEAQAELYREQEAARAQLLATQHTQDADQRSLKLAHDLANTRAAAGASGIDPNEGSAAAVATGQQQEAATAQADADQVYQAQINNGRRSLLYADPGLNSYLRAGQSFGSAVQSLLD